MAWAETHKGKYRGRYRDETGAVRSAGTATSKRAAKKLAEEKESEIRRGVWHDPRAGDITFAEYFEQHWMPSRVRELNTIATNESHYRSSLKPAFGAWPLNRITPAAVQRWVRDELALVQAKGGRPSTVDAKLKTLSQVLGGRGVSAVRDRLIAHNPCEGLERPFCDKPEVKIFTPGEVSLIMGSIPRWFQPVPILGAESGLRWGELMGIRVCDFTEGYGAVTVQRTIGELTKAYTGRDTPFYWKDRPKDRKPRTVALDPMVGRLVETLVRERQLFPMDRLLSSPGADGLPRRTGLWPEGLPIGRSYHRESVWKPAQLKAEVEVRKFHALRGSHISWLLSGGADLGTVMERVGHSNLSTTQAYVARMPDAEQKALNALATVRSQFDQGTGSDIDRYLAADGYAAGGSRCGEGGLLPRVPSVQREEN